MFYLILLPVHGSEYEDIACDDKESHHYQRYLKRQFEVVPLRHHFPARRGPG